MAKFSTREYFLLSITLLILFISNACRTVNQNNNSLESELEENDIRIAAVGDSITAEFIPEASYPTALEEMLGKGYTVQNFGVSNYAAQSSSDFPYETTDLYKKSLAFDPNIVIIMLGTNDTKANNWSGSEEFKEEYTMLLESYLELESISRVILASPPTAFLENIFEGSIDPDNIEPIRDVVNEIAEEYELEFVDMTEHTANHSEWFFDGIHPNSKGAEEIAQIFYKQIQE